MSYLYGRPLQCWLDSGGAPDRALHQFTCFTSTQVQILTPEELHLQCWLDSERLLLPPPEAAEPGGGRRREGKEEGDDAAGEGAGGGWRAEWGGEGSGGLLSVILAAIKHAEAAVLFMSDEYAGECQYEALGY
jgi:hypothetical protein